MTTPPYIFAVDPGCTESAFLRYEHPPGRILEFGKIPNDEMLGKLRQASQQDHVLVIESVASYGMAVGFEVFETVFWSGRYWEAWYGPKDRLYRAAVKTALCHDSRANDPAIRRRLMDLFGGDMSVRAQQCPRCKGTGRRLKAQIPCGCDGGWKIKPGALHGISKDVWAALGVAVAYAGGSRSQIKGTEC